MPIVERNPLPQVHLTTADELEAWLAEHHATSAGIWLVSWRSGPNIAYEDVVRLCLCFGWIDSTVQKLDEGRRALRLTPRRPGSVWSAPNKQRIAELAEQGRLRPAGEAALRRARSDGSYNLLNGVDRLEVPADLAEALGTARAVFEAFTPGRRKQALAWIAMAKRAPTRAARVARVAEAAHEGRSLF